ncbi:hypothetical protein OROMI_011381 [Orobanche minor]
MCLFGEVWGIGPATAKKLYEKGHRTLDDLKNEGSLTNAQQLGLKYFDDIRKRIPRNEAQEMVCLLEKAGEDVLPGICAPELKEPKNSYFCSFLSRYVVIVCGGSYRRGKASCGDLDIIITHPDGNSHIGFLPKFVKHLKDMKFLREDLVFSTHSEEVMILVLTHNLGFAHPGRELPHRIDIKVYPLELYAFALVRWTCNDVLNRRLRVLAESKGFLLDDDGLYSRLHGKISVKGKRGSASLKFDSEIEVFNFLGLPWLRPHDRNL